MVCDKQVFHDGLMREVHVWAARTRAGVAVWSLSMRPAVCSVRAAGCLTACRCLGCSSGAAIGYDGRHEAGLGWVCCGWTMRFGQREAPSKPGINPEFIVRPSGQQCILINFPIHRGAIGSPSGRLLPMATNGCGAREPGFAAAAS